MNKLLPLLALMSVPVCMNAAPPAHKKQHVSRTTNVVLTGWGSGQQFSYPSRKDVIEAQPGHTPKNIKTDEQARQYIGEFLRRMVIVDDKTRAKVLQRNDPPGFTKVQLITGDHAGKSVWIQTKYVHSLK